MMRVDFEMEQGDLDTLLAAIQPAPAIAIHCGPQASAQERANAAWAALGKKMGFEAMTVRPNGRGDLHFSAEPVAQA